MPRLNLQNFQEELATNGHLGGVRMKAKLLARRAARTTGVPTGVASASAPPKAKTTKKTEDKPKKAKKPLFGKKGTSEALPSASKKNAPTDD